MRPKVIQAWSTHQSGAWSLIDAISPATEASTSHTTAIVRHTPTTSELLWSARSLAATSAALGWVRPAAGSIAC